MANSIFTVNEIRKSYVDFFQKNDHKQVPSASLIPAKDPTLLFNTAGMVPFKNYFAGIETPPHARITSIQKCLRTTDLEEVGKTKRHLSFFEMLGNFSFGDYFKKEAIEFAWEFSSNYLPFANEQIWVTVYQDDDEAYDLWTKHIGFPKDRIVRLGKKDNFWGPAGETGACGPCSELYLDRGLEFQTDENDTQPGAEGERFMEFWNLVFNQYNQAADGTMNPLAQTGIDTGAGLERLATLIQGVDSVYEIDEFKEIRASIAGAYSTTYENENIVPMRVLSDHIRALTFCMADGIFPANESRGYVLRRMLRRALMFGRKLGQAEPTLFKVVPTIEKIYSEFYPELSQNINLIQDYIKQEEERFLSTLTSGSNKLEELLIKAQATDKKIAGSDAFTLYDTFGFPLEMTIEFAQAREVHVDGQGFEEEMEKQRERGRKAWKGNAATLNIDTKVKTEFTGFKINNNSEHKSNIIQIFIDDKASEEVNDKDSFKTVSIITQKTPFYAEGGGQLGDTGKIKTTDGEATVIDTQKMGDAFIHVVKEVQGSISINSSANLKVDNKRRSALEKNHSATHLLNAALRRKLGDHIKQTGSLVHPDYFRFDFSNPKGLSSDELIAIEKDVNQAIEKSIVVDTQVLPIEEAKSKGAIMTFGEKYGDVVRVVQMGDQSTEFCGGTHVANTVDIQLLLIQKESSPGAGNRRIEAKTGQSALDFMNNKVIELKSNLEKTKATVPKELQKDFESLLNNITSFKVEASYDSIHSFKELTTNFEKLEKDLKKAQKKGSQKSSLSEEVTNEVLDLAQNRMKINNASTAFIVKDSLSIPDMKSLIDLLREKDASAVYFIASVDAQSNKWNFVAGTSRKYTEEKSINLGKALKESLKTSSLQGGGGGKNEIAQASGVITTTNDEVVIELDKLAGLLV